jgi:hypothetical protein
MFGKLLCFLGFHDKSVKWIDKSDKEFPVLRWRCTRCNRRFFRFQHDKYQEPK